MQRYPRDLRGYGPQTPDPKWPGGAKIAVQFVVNYEEGGENCLLHGDPHSEAFLSEIVGAQAWPDQRHWNMESLYEYGARAGFWRLYRLFTEQKIPVTVFGVATALQRGPEQVAAMMAADWEIASHGLKWIDYKDFSREEERAHIQEALALHRLVTGERPAGWYTGRCSMQTFDLISEIGGFTYIADSYADDLPYWHEAPEGGGEDLLCVPYTLDVNDMRFATAQGFNSGDQFFSYLKDSFDALYEEGCAGQAKMLSVGLHCRLVGRPGRIQALKRFLAYAQSHQDVWFARRVDIARHWRHVFPLQKGRLCPSRLSEEDFIATFGGVFEHSPWIAERAYQAPLGGSFDHAQGLHAALTWEFRKASEGDRLGVLMAHPDLAGKLAQAKRLTEESTQEQASAGLDVLSDQEREAFTALNTSYTAKFGFPFIIAVKGLTKDFILQRFQERLENGREQEFAEACAQVEKIALFRVKDLFGEER